MHGEPPVEEKKHEPKTIENPGKPKVIIHKKGLCIMSRLFESILREKRVDYPESFTSGFRYMNFNFVAAKVEKMLEEKGLVPSDPEFEDFLQECLNEIDPDMPAECREESLRLVRAGFVGDEAGNGSVLRGRNHVRAKGI